MVKNDGLDRPSRDFARHSDFERGWYSQAPIPSSPPPSFEPPSIEIIATPGWSTLLGALSGGLGGIIMLIVAQGVLVLGHSSVDLVRGLGRAIAGDNGNVGDPRIVAILAAAAMGALLGAPLGFMTRRLLRIVPRVLFFTLLLPTLWLFLRALIIGKLAADKASALPFGPLVAGLVFYGVCVAVVTPPHIRLLRRRRPMPG
jgi:hypothetical protein